jgi:pyrimidine-nucleoside phosphorylase
MNPRILIARKRDGGHLDEREIREFIGGYLENEVADYQMAAFLMAVLFRGMSREETVALTRAMIDSGRVLDLSALAPTADKHSTGGVGDKVSLALAPLVAAEGVRVPMISGRGLGHTGGTLDKLESIPGFRTRLSAEEFIGILGRTGVAMAGQSEDLVPADRRMYALRDVTATVESLPLVTSSILSKKIAAGPENLVFDVKVGRGAFFTDRARAAALASELVSVAGAFGRRAVAFLTDMDRPLGAAVGNAVEVEEAIAVLRGAAPADLTEVTLVLAAAMLVLAGTSPDLFAASERLAGRIRDGSALAKLREMIEAQGGDPRVVDDPKLLPRAASEAVVESPSDGVVADIDPRAIAELVTDLGGGRRRLEDTIDPGVGVLLDRTHGDAVNKGAPLARVRFSRGRADEWVARARAAFVITRAPAPARAAILAVIDAKGEREWRGWSTPSPAQEPRG